jgi:hypothetical protein
MRFKSKDIKRFEKTIAKVFDIDPRCPVFGEAWDNKDKEIHKGNR